MKTPKELQGAVDSILDGWFGQAVEDSEDEAALVKSLYGPLRNLVCSAYVDGTYDAVMALTGRDSET